MTLVERMTIQRERVAEAALSAGRRPQEVTLIAVSKGHCVEAIRTLAEVGVEDFGESYVQEWKSKAAQLSRGIRWHYIGGLQSNKARELVNDVTLIHSIDRIRLARELDRRASAPQDVLLQVDLGGEDAKGGCPPEALSDLLHACLQSDTLRPTGLMTLPPWDEDPEAARPLFRRLRELRDALQEELSREDDFLAARFQHLSMGMSHDAHVAIAEGATHVRIGSAIFGPRA